MKKIMSFMVIAILACGALFAATTRTQQIVITSVVAPVQPEFVIRNMQTGETGKSVIYSTDSIVKNDVSTGFQIIQSNDCNYIGDIELTVRATELAAVVDGVRYQTNGVGIQMNGQNFGSTASMILSYNGIVRMSSEVGAFNVTWNTCEGLAQATYQATVALNYTAR